MSQPNNLTYNTLKWLCMAMASQIFVLYGILYYLKSITGFDPYADADNMEVIFYAFIAVSIGTFLMHQFLKNFLFQKAKLQSKSHYYSYQLILYSMHQTYSVYGFVLALISRYQLPYQWFFGVSIALSLMYFPQDVSDYEWERLRNILK